VDYVPGRRVSVLYEARVDGVPRQAGATIDTRGGRDPGRGWVISWLPLDPRLPGLAAPPAVVAAALESHGLDPAAAEGRLLAYRLGVRAVFTRGNLVLKAYGDAASFVASARAQRLADRHGGLPVARWLGAVPALRLSALERVRGAQLGRADAVRVAAETGSVLARLHGAGIHGVPRVGPRVHLERAAEGVRLAVTLEPGLRRRALRVLARLEGALPDGAAVTCHGDFNVGQLMRRAGGLVVLDVDELGKAHAALDLASYAADLIAGRPGDVQAAREVLERLLTGYGRRPEGLSWYVAAITLRRAPNSFRLWKSHWPERLERMIAAADKALSW
jgi:aminoglycoside phosphotransferase (APT) family kinase protein